ncbi:hypothetical protein CgunFtcFv8_006900 [Champsocephalus gunnari]|uniref:Uncharacterized protein n=1 Tax=Champsocephalus gunnari TaxID=52237 RepID=A0AAN8CIK9_CHAGU|nr:hypothetical protein CgunFtcFv8_006900 [Champsocephalus gunnari]
MSGFRRIVMSSLLMQLLHFPAADGEYDFLTVRPGDEVTLPCDYVIPDQDNAQSSGGATTTGTPGLLRLILVSVGLAALIVTVVTVHIWTRAKGGEKRMRKNLEQNDEDEDEVNYENDGGASAPV